MNYFTALFFSLSNIFNKQGGDFFSGRLSGHDKVPIANRAPNSRPSNCSTEPKQGVYSFFSMSWVAPRRAFRLAPPRFQNSPPQVQNDLGGLHPPFPPPLVTDAYA
jgi:hypothetical protein